MPLAARVIFAGGFEVLRCAGGKRQHLVGDLPLLCLPLNPACEPGDLAIDEARAVQASQ